MGNSGQNFTRFLVVKKYEDREYMLAYSQVSGMLYIPNHEPTLFEDLVLLKKVIKKSKKYMQETNPYIESKAEYMIYELEFSLLNHY